MGSDTDVCPRCNQDGGALQFVSPDLLTKEIIESIDSGLSDLNEQEGIEVCAECLAELKQE